MKIDINLKESDIDIIGKDNIENILDKLDYIPDIDYLLEEENKCIKISLDVEIDLLMKIKSHFTNGLSLGDQYKIPGILRMIDHCVDSLCD